MKKKCPLCKKEFFCKGKCPRKKIAICLCPYCLKIVLRESNERLNVLEENIRRIRISCYEILLDDNENPSRRYRYKGENIV